MNYNQIVILVVTLNLGFQIRNVNIQARFKKNFTFAEDLFHLKDAKRLVVLTEKNIYEMQRVKQDVEIQYAFLKLQFQSSNYD
jgi:hypothetical protein